MAWRARTAGRNWEKLGEEAVVLPCVPLGPHLPQPWDSAARSGRQHQQLGLIKGGKEEAVQSNLLIQNQGIF